jgi:hypothetical protein
MWITILAMINPHLTSPPISFAQAHSWVERRPSFRLIPHWTRLTDDFFSPTGDNNDSNFFPSITFDADDINIVWDTFDDTSQFAFNGPANGGREPFGTASFRVTVPEPTTLALLGLGLAGFGFSRRKQ